jgi:hypothetical protein
MWGDSKREGPVGVSCGSQSIVGASKWQDSYGLYAEVLFWCASGPITRR